jgi:hypothetical protein
MALVVERDLEWRPEVIGVAMYEASEEGETAEVAIVIQDHWQGRGLGCIRPAVRRARPDHRLLAANLLFEFLSLIALGR